MVNLRGKTRSMVLSKQWTIIKHKTAETVWWNIFNSVNEAVHRRGSVRWEVQEKIFWRDWYE